MNHDPQHWTPEIVDLELVEPDDSALISSEARGSLAGSVTSIVLHVWLIAVLAGVTMHDRIPLTAPPLDTRLVEPEEEEPDEPIEYELAQPDERDLEVREVVNAASVGLSPTTQPKIQSAPLPIDDTHSLEVRHELYDIPEGVDIDERLVVKGTTGEALIQLESALDRVTWEIAQNLQERKVLVVWLIDASGSLTEQRKIIAERLKRIYGELDALEAVDQIPRMDQPLLSGVVTFGLQTTFVTREPTTDLDVIIDALENAPTCPSGVENVFGAVTQVMQLWSKYRVREGRRIMIVTVTDEAGDDFATHLDVAINRCRHYGAKAYVIGPPAVFGRREGYVPYVAPEDGETYQLPVDLGPDVPMPDNVDLPFWYNGPQYKYLSAGFGPYALAKLVYETGGVYFMTNMTTTTGLSPLGVYDSALLKPIEPDYRFNTPEEFRRDLARYPIRAAVVTAAKLSREYEAKGTPTLSIRVTPGNFRQQASEAQKIVAESQLAIDTILKAFPPELEKLYDQEPSLRWRTAYNLAYGRLLAQKIRCLEYNYACAYLKNELSPEEVGSKSNHWIFRPSKDINYANSARKAAVKAEGLLQQVIDDAPGTPFAVLAARELKYPLGIEIVQRYVPPVQRTPQTARRQEPKPRLLLADEKKPQPAKKPEPKPKPKLPKL
jgi:hypothetical protein